jgi:hypothetical protein
MQLNKDDAHNNNNNNNNIVLPILGEGVSFDRIFIHL